MINTPKGRQQWILDLLKSEPSMSYGECWSKYKANWRKSESTFATDWKKAKNEHSTWQRYIQEQISAKITGEEINARKQNIVTKIEALEILSEIAKGKEKKVKGNFYTPSFRERISAIAELAKLEGWNEPIKSDITSNGKDINQGFVIEVIDKREDVRQEEEK